MLVRSTSKQTVSCVSSGTETEPDTLVNWLKLLEMRTFWFLRATATGEMDQEKKGGKEEQM